MIPNRTKTHQNKTISLLLLIGCIICLANFTYAGRTVTLPWLKVEGTQFKNAHGEIVHLRGVNLFNNACGNWIYGISDQPERKGKDPLIRPTEQDDWVLGPYDYYYINKLGGNVVRYCFNYELFAKDNPKRAKNLEKLKEHVKRFNGSAIYVILNLHFPPGLDVAHDHYEKDKPGNERLQSIFENDEYFDQTVEMWKHLAKAFKDNAGVAGYELFSEPRLPSEADGGVEKFTERYNKLVNEIRKVDNQHIIFVAEYDSVEANDEFQTIKWGERGFVKVDADNIAYVGHCYEPYEFTHLGAAKFKKDKVNAYLKKKLDWTNEVGQAPLIITEYGVNRNQPIEKKVEYLEVIHSFCKKNNLSSLFWEYKSQVGAFTAPMWINGVYAQYVKKGEELIIKVNKYEYQPWAKEAAHQNGFDELFTKYFWQQNNPADISIMDNQKVWESLNRFFK